jgi:hypothetical protein
MCAFSSGARHVLSADGPSAGLPPPVFGEAKDGGKGKIVDGNRICHELGFEYQYPDPLVMPME